jgi:hypothetical protein
MTITYYNFGGGAGGGGAGGGTNNGGAGGVAAGTISGADVLVNVNGQQAFGGTSGDFGAFGFSGDVNVDSFGAAYPGGYGGGYGQPGTAPLYAGTGGIGPGGFSSSGAGGTGGGAIGVGGANITWKSYGNIAGTIGSWGTWGGTGADFSGLIAAHTIPAKETIANAGWTYFLGNRWYWNAYNAGQAGQPAGPVTFYMPYANTTGSNITAHLYGCVDQTLTTLAINGGSVSIGPAFGFIAPQSTTSFTLVPGANVIAVTITNSAGTVAGFNLRLRRTSDDAILAGPIGWFY